LLRHLSRKLLALFELVTIADIGMMLLAVSAIKVFDTKHSSLKSAVSLPNALASVP